MNYRQIDYLIKKKSNEFKKINLVKEVKIVNLKLISYKKVIKNSTNNYIKFNKK